MKRARAVLLITLASVAITAANCPSESSDTRCEQAARAVAEDPNDPQKQAAYERYC